jgi:multimeric flavodoxin WrbA
VGASRHLLVLHHSRGGTTGTLCDAAVEGARDAVGSEVELRVLAAQDAGPDDVAWADALLLATPARFGSMAGMVKDFFERIYYACLQSSAGLSYALVVKGDTDVEGAVASVERITTGLQWRQVLPPVRVVGGVEPEHREQARELGATLAAGLEAGIF